MSGNRESLQFNSMQSVKYLLIFIINIKLYSCKGTGFIPASYQPCPRCGGEGKELFKDCRLCDDLCYVTEPWIQCNVCFGKGKSGHLGVLSPDCYACRGVGYVKPGFGVGAPGIGAYGAPGVGAYGAPGIVPPLGGGVYPPPVQPAYGTYGAYGAYGTTAYNPTFMPPPPDYF